MVSTLRVSFLGGRSVDNTLAITKDNVQATLSSTLLHSYFLYSFTEYFIVYLHVCVLVHQG